jgi:3-hydroxyacyl-CoA dehydrogenase
VSFQTSTTKFADSVTSFIIGRLLDAVKRESLQIVAEGVTNPEDLDNLWVS